MPGPWPSEEELGDRPGMAASYHQLGIVAQLRGRLDEAADWYARSLAISEELGDRPKMVTSYHQLGMVAQVRGRLDEAADWYARSLAIRRGARRPARDGASYGQLGLLAEAGAVPARRWSGWSGAWRSSMTSRIHLPGQVPVTSPG